MKIAAIVVGVLLALVLAGTVYVQREIRYTNPKVALEIRENPQGERAQKVMLLTLPNEETIPVNFLREDGRLYAGADGLWWKQLQGAPIAVTVFVQGEEVVGRARAVLDQPDYTRDVFSRLRPTAVPGFGTLIEILLSPEDPGGPIRNRKGGPAMNPGPKHSE